VTQTPVRTLGENMMRMQDMLEQAGASFSLLEREFAAAVVKRGIHLMAREGIIPPLTVDGQAVTIQFTSPLAQARDQQELQGVNLYAQTMSMVAPQEAGMMMDPDETSDYVREKIGLPARLIRSKEDRAEIMQQMMAAAQQQGGGGGTPGA